MVDNVNQIYSDSVVNRFWKYLKVGKKDECWEWSGSRAVRGGYGQLNDRHKLLKVHRISYELHKGKIPEGEMICHKCNNPPCCNPNHLYAGTNTDNTRDRIVSGTQYNIPPLSGEKSPSAKLTYEIVKEIRQSSESCAALGKKYGVSKTAISYIRRGRTWKKAV